MGLDVDQSIPKYCIANITDLDFAEHFGLSTKYIKPLSPLRFSRIAALNWNRQYLDVYIKWHGDGGACTVSVIFLNYEKGESADIPTITVWKLTQSCRNKISKSADYIFQIIFSKKRFKCLLNFFYVALTGLIDKKLAVVRIISSISDKPLKGPLKIQPHKWVIVHYVDLSL